MSMTAKKELAVVEDLDIGFGSTDQDRGGLRVNAHTLPYTSTISIGEALDDRPDKATLDTLYAALHGNQNVVFEVAGGMNGFEAVNYSQLELKADQTAVDLKADKANVLELDNDASYVPLFDFNPATKQYVDGSIADAFFGAVSGSFTSADGKTITVTGGLITGIL